MKKEAKDITGALGYYVEGDYMEKETTENGVTLLQENMAGFRIAVHKEKRIMITCPDNKIPSIIYDFDNKEDWEDFCEATWETEHYVGIRKEHFVEMFEALMFVESYHKNRLSQARLKFDAVAQEIKEQEHGLRQLRNIVERYEEVYSENKVQ